MFTISPRPEAGIHKKSEAIVLPGELVIKKAVSMSILKVDFSDDNLMLYKFCELHCLVRGFVSESRQTGRIPLGFAFKTGSSNQKKPRPNPPFPKLQSTRELDQDMDAFYLA